MFVTDIMKQYVIAVTKKHIVIELKGMIKKLEPHFDFNGWGFDANEGFYWCDELGRLMFTSQSNKLPDNYALMKDDVLYEMVKEALYHKRIEDEKHLEEARRALEKILDYHIPKQQINNTSMLTQLHFSFDGFTTNCIAKTKKGVVARSKATAVGEDKEHFDQLIGANVALLKLMPKEAWPEFLEALMAIVGIDFQVDFNVNAKLVNADEA